MPNNIYHKRNANAGVVPTAAQLTVRYFAFRMGGYSLGVSMTAAQALAYYNAMQAFQTALGRQV